MVKYRQIIRVICFVLLLIALTFKTTSFQIIRMIYPAPLIAFWLILDRYVLKNHSKSIELTDTKITRRANYIYWTIYIVSFVILETINVCKINLRGILFAFIICEAEFRKEIIAWLYKKLKEHQLHNETTKVLAEIEDKKDEKGKKATFKRLLF